MPTRWATATEVRQRDDRRSLDNGPAERHTRAQKFDGKSEGKFDGSPPDPHTEPSWRGVLLMLVVVGVVLVLVAYAFVVIGFDLPPRIRI